MAKRKDTPSPKPPGCRTRLGAPWVMGDGGMKRCTCPRGVWYLQREREHLPHALVELRELKLTGSI